MRLLLICSLLTILLAAGCQPTADSDSSVIEDLNPTVILISIDGFRPDYMDWYETPALERLASEGIRAPQGMQPAFPSKTFPNHYTIATGLYPAKHGIVANTMYDPDMDAVFRISDRGAVEDPRWWGGEPIWVTAEKQDQRAATYFWVGSEAPVAGVRPSIWKRYDSSIPGSERVAETLEWLDLPLAERPTFLSMYFEDVDNAGHRYGPESSEARAAVERVDGYISQLLDGLESRGILDKVHVIVVSDHGMAPTSPDRIVVLEDYVDPTDVMYTELRELVMLNAVPGKEQIVREGLMKMPHVTIFSEAELDSLYSYTGNARIPSVVGVADEGWIVIRDRTLLEDRPGYGKGGSHGYAPELPSMHALFVARGPMLQPGSTLPPFANVDVYELLCHLLGLQPAPNDGTLETFVPVLRSM